MMVFLPVRKKLSDCVFVIWIGLVTLGAFAPRAGADPLKSVGAAPAFRGSFKGAKTEASMRKTTPQMSKDRRDESPLVPRLKATWR